MGNGIWLALLLSRLIGSPMLVVLGLVLAGGWAAEQLAPGAAAGPLRHFRRWQRSRALFRELSINEHNRRARFELADILCEQRRYARALDFLKPNVAAGDDDVATLLLMGVAADGAGYRAQAETFLLEARARDASYRMGAIDLELGRGRLRAGDFAGAKAALETFCQARKGSVEGKVLLARALAGLGESAPAAEMRRQAWADYRSAPRFIRRQERAWAWRLQPWRPIALVLAAALLAFAISQAAAGSSAPGAARPGFVQTSDEP